MAMADKGTKSIFRGKGNGYRVQAVLTPIGGQWFRRWLERGRKPLATAAKVDPESVSDADLIEHLTRGAENTGRYINGEDIPPTKG